jgi:hypothetical protein
MGLQRFVHDWYWAIVNRSTIGGLPDIDLVRSGGSITNDGVIQLIGWKVDIADCCKVLQTHCSKLNTNVLYPMEEPCEPFHKAEVPSFSVEVCEM